MKSGNLKFSGTLWVHSRPVTGLLYIFHNDQWRIKPFGGQLLIISVVNSRRRNEDPKYCLLLENEIQSQRTDNKF